MSLERGAVYWVSLNPTQGREQRGHRPVLLVSPLAFNRRTNTPIVLPITTGGGFAKALGFAVPLPPSMTTRGIVRCDQPRALDLTARDGRFAERAPAALVEEALARLTALFV